MPMDMPPGIEHMHAAQVEGSIQSMEDAADMARKIANEENPDQNTGTKVIETKGAKTTISWDKNEEAGTLVAHITLEAGGKSETRDVTFSDMTGGRGDHPIYEQGTGPLAALK